MSGFYTFYFRHMLFRVYIASSRHEEGWEICITFENSPNPPSVQMRLYKHVEKCSIAFIKQFSKINAYLKRHNRVYILSSKHTHRPMRARIVAQIFYKLSLVEHIKGTASRFAHVEMLSLNFPSSPSVNRVNLLHP